MNSVVTEFAHLRVLYGVFQSLLLLGVNIQLGSVLMGEPPF